MTVSIETGRIDTVVAESEIRFNTIKQFAESKKKILNDSADKFKAFADNFKAINFTIYNMYSSGSSVFNSEFTEEASLIAHGAMSLSKVPINLNSLTTKLEKVWKELIPENIQVSFKSWKIKGSVVEFQIWVK